jgi:hypothetical protein
MTTSRDGEGEGGATRATGEHRAVRVTGEHATHTGTHATHTGTHTATHTTTRATPMGTATMRGGKQLGLKLFGVAALDHPGSTTPFVAGTELVTFREIGAVVAPSPYIADPLTPHDLEAHGAVVTEVFERRAIVPAPPGTVFRSRERLLNWLELHYYTLTEALEFVTERAVARVTVRRDDQTTPPVLTPGTLRLAPAVDEAASGPVSDVVALAADAFRELRRDAVALIVLRTDPEAAQAGDEAHASFLIERTRWQAFVDAVAVQNRRHAALRLDCSGPWPPFDFVRMQFTA